MPEPALQFLLIVDSHSSSAARIKKLGLGFALALRHIRERGHIARRVSGALLTSRELKGTARFFPARAHSEWLSAQAIERKCLDVIKDLAGEAADALSRRRPARESASWPAFRETIDAVAFAMHCISVQAPHKGRRLLILYSDALNSADGGLFEAAVERLRDVDAPNLVSLLVGYNARDARDGCIVGWRLMPHDLRSVSAVAGHAMQVLERFAGSDWIAGGPTQASPVPTIPAHIHAGCGTCGSMGVSADQGRVCRVCGVGRVEWMPATVGAIAASVSSGGPKSNASRPARTHGGRSRCDRCGSECSRSSNGQVCVVCGVGRMNRVEGDTDGVGWEDPPRNGRGDSPDLAPTRRGPSSMPVPVSAGSFGLSCVPILGILTVYRLASCFLEAKRVLDEERAAGGPKTCGQPAVNMKLATLLAAIVLQGLVLILALFVISAMTR